MTISIDVIGVESSVAIKSIKKIARSQHTNPNSGFTNSISRAMESALKEISGDLVGLTPWSQDLKSQAAETQTAAQQTDPVASLQQQPAIVGSPSVTNDVNSQPLPLTNTTSLAPVTSSSETAIEPGSCDENSRTSSLSAIPDTLNPGDSLRLVSCYSISTTDKTKTNFATILSSPSGRKSVVSENVSEKSSGYWKAEFDINIPEKTTSGIYTLIQLISHEGKVETLEEKMIVR